MSMRGPRVKEAGGPTDYSLPPRTQGVKRMNRHTDLHDSCPVNNLLDEHLGGGYIELGQEWGSLLVGARLEVDGSRIVNWPFRTSFGGI